jgi:transposase
VVAVSTVITWVKRYQETGSVEPGRMGGHKRKAIRGEHETFLTQWMDASLHAERPARHRSAAGAVD